MKIEKILLVGNPNVGKSAIFSRLTGVKVIISNYPGTTVEFTQGKMKLDDEIVMIVDVPGTYTLEPTCKAEDVACRMVKEGGLVINIIDATNLERNLHLTLQLLEKDIPVIVVLNMWDDTKHRGIYIIDFFAYIFTPVLTGLWGLPKEAISALYAKIYIHNDYCCITDRNITQLNTSCLIKLRVLLKLSLCI